MTSYYVWTSQALPQETARDAAERYVRETFAEDRQIVWLQSPGEFCLVDGVWSYRIAFNGSHWQVQRLDPLSSMQ